jgi:transcriptional regulator with XRE-family HTH domain
VSSGEPELGQMVRVFRGRAGLTQEELAERAGVTAQSIGNIERGVTLSPRADVLQRLVDALELAPDEENALRRAARAAVRGSQRPSPWAVPPAASSPVTGEAGSAATLAKPPPDESWHAGLPIILGDRHYLLEDPVEEVRAAPDRSWTWRDAPAQALRAPRSPVWLRRVATVRGPSESGPWHRALATQHRLLAELSAAGLLPPAQDLHEMGRGAAGWRTTLVQGLPQEAATLRQTFGPSARPLDRWQTAALLAAMVPVCAALGELHRLQFSHRLLSPDVVLVVGGGGHAVLRDLGLAGAPVAPDEGWAPYRAPEQRRRPPPGQEPGPGTDVYQLAAVLYHVLTGHPPAPALAPPPLAATNRDLPSDLDEVLRAALSPAPRDRPQAMDAMSSVLHWAAERVKRGAGR